MCGEFGRHLRGTQFPPCGQVAKHRCGEGYPGKTSLAELSGQTPSWGRSARCGSREVRGVCEFPEAQRGPQDGSRRPGTG